MKTATPEDLIAESVLAFDMLHLGDVRAAKEQLRKLERMIVESGFTAGDLLVQVQNLLSLSNEEIAEELAGVSSDAES